ncbi:hypothetical protein LguiB_003344 [Lonicera macranthoides]
MRVFKWTIDFRVDIEAAIAPVWVSFPQLPILFFAKQSLFAIASMVGRPLCMDNAIAQLTRPSVARISVEGHSKDICKMENDAKITITRRRVNIVTPVETNQVMGPNVASVEGTLGVRGNALVISSVAPVENVSNVSKFDASMVKTISSTPVIIPMHKQASLIVNS